MAKRKLRLQTFELVEDAVSNGVDFGWRRAHKHGAEPDPDDILAAIEAAVMERLGEVVDFDRS